MGPKNNLQMEEDVEDIKKSLNFLTAEVRLQQSSILDLVKEVKTLK